MSQTFLRVQNTKYLVTYVHSIAAVDTPNVVFTLQDFFEGSYIQFVAFGKLKLLLNLHEMLLRV